MLPDIRSDLGMSLHLGMFGANPLVDVRMDLVMDTSWNRIVQNLCVFVCCLLCMYVCFVVMYVLLLLYCINWQNSDAIFDV